MNIIPSSKNLILAAAFSLGLVSAASAQSANVAVPNPADSKPTGLLGQNYVTLGYGYTDLDSTSIHASTYTLSANQSLREGLDGIFEYNYTRTSQFGSSQRLTQHDIMLGARAFLTSGVVKPYVEAGAGWVWERSAVHDDSFAWGLGVGAEIEVINALTVTPFVRYEDITKGSDNDTWTYGVKTNYWLNRSLGLQAGIARDDDKNMTYTVGANIRF